MAGLHIVSNNPWIIHGYNFGNIFSPVKQLAPYFDCKKNDTIHYLVTLTWTVLLPHRIENLARYYRKHIKKYPRQKLHSLLMKQQSLNFSINMICLQFFAIITHFLMKTDIR